MTYIRWFEVSQDWSEIERSFGEVGRGFDFFDSLTPTNEEKQRELFEEGVIDNPSFEYPELTYSPHDRAEAIEAIEIPEGEFEEAFQKRLNRLRNKNQVLKHRGNREKVREASAEMYGRPAEGLSHFAEITLEEIPESETDRPCSAQNVKTAVEKAMALCEREYGEDIFGDWSIKIDGNRNTGYASRGNKEFIIGERDYLPEDPWRYVVHEVGRHALLKANRDFQKEDEERANLLRNFAYEQETEEGITTNLERVTGLETNELIRKYALRTLAVESVMEDDDFRDTYQKLSRWESDSDRLWKTCLRAHRGGGLLKDHIYLQGRERVRSYLEGGGRLKPFYVGKVPLDSVETSEELLERGQLEDPPYSPEILHKNIGEVW